MEIIVVFIIIGILSALVVLNSGSVSKSTQSTIAQGNLQRAIVYEKSLALENGTFSDTVLSLTPPNGLSFTNTNSRSENEISIKLDTNSNLYLAVLGSDGVCYGKSVSDAAGSVQESNLTLTNSGCSAGLAITN